MLSDVSRRKMRHSKRLASTSCRAVTSETADPSEPPAAGIDHRSILDGGIAPGFVAEKVADPAGIDHRSILDGGIAPGFLAEIILGNSCALGRGFPNHIGLCKVFPPENLCGISFGAKNLCTNSLCEPCALLREHFNFGISKRPIPKERNHFDFGIGTSTDSK